MVTLLLRGVGEKGPDAREFACGRRRAKALSPPVRKERPKVGCTKIQQALGPYLPSSIAAEECDEAVSGRDIGPDGMRRSAKIVFKVDAPLYRERCGRMN